MKKLLLVLALVALAMPAFAAPISAVNTRPVTIGSTSDPASSCSAVAADCELQTLLNYLEPGFNAFSDQQPTGMWKLGGGGATIPMMRIEVTANQSTQQLGIWSDADMDDSTTDDRSLVDIFLGNATGETTGGQTTASLVFNANGSLIIGDAGGTGGVNVGTFNGINRYSFGFYLQPYADTRTWYSVDQLNGGLQQMVAYLYTAPTGGGRWTIGFEDTAYLQGDHDYNDLMFQIESIEAVPEPGSMLLLGTGLFGLAGAVRRRMKK